VSVKRLLNLLALVVFSSALFTRAVDPVIPQIAMELDVLPRTAALVSTAYTLPYALIQPMLGILADMFNKTRLILISLALITVATFASIFVTSFEQLVIARIIAGVAAGGLIPIVFAFVGDLVPVAERQVAMGRLLFAIMTGNLLGATAAGAVADLFSWRAVFIFLAGLGALVLAVSIPGLGGEGKAGGRFDLSTVGSNYRAIFSNPMAKICFGAVFLEAVFMYGLFPHLATLLYAAGETRASIAGIILAGFGIGGVIYSLRVSFLLEHVGERWMMRLGGLLMGLCLTVVALRLPWQAEFINFIVLGLAFYLLHAVIQVYASELAPEARGSAMALHSFFFFLGHATGPAVYSLGLATVGVNVVLLTGAGILTVTGAICAHYLRRPAARS
jgi:predicted MFS family arabinose efflux permease